MREKLYIGLAGAAGAMTRLAAGRLYLQEGHFPIATFLINMTGTFLLCYLVERARHLGRLNPLAVTVMTTGFLGAYTTFSAVSLETVQLIEDGFHWMAAGYIAGSLAGGLLMATIGFSLAKKVGVSNDV